MSVTISYSLKRFNSSVNPDFAAALLLYTRNTPSNIRTDTNEITYWLDNFSNKFGDDFYVFGFYRNKQLVGYAEAAYFCGERLFAFDYIVIDKIHRRNNVFYEFVDHLKSYMESNRPEYRYAVAEVPYGSGQEYPSQESRLLARLLKMQGFRIIRAPYYQPRLMLEDAESEMSADLLIYSTNGLESIRRDTYLDIVHTVYYKYYLRWKNITPNSLAAYNIHLDSLYSKIKSGVGKKQIILINGHQSVLETPNKKTVLTLHKITSFSLQALAVIILLTAAILGLKAAFNLSNASLIAVYILAISSFMAVAGIISKQAREIFKEFIELAKFVSRRKLSDSTPTEIEKESSSPADQLKK